MPEDVDFEEKDTLKLILKYREFNQFYMNERQNIHNKILWFKDIDSSDDFYAAYAVPYIESDRHEIHFRRVPGSKTDAFLSAHEMLHLIRAENNQTPQVRCDERYIELEVALASLLEDPIVDSILKTKYGFNLRPFYMSVIENGKKKVSGDYADDFDKLKDAWSHAGWALKWRLITDKSAIKSWKKFNRKFENMRPKAYKISLDTITIVDNIGVDTKEKQVTVMKKLINNYNLKDLILLD